MTDLLPHQGTRNTPVPKGFMSIFMKKIMYESGILPCHADTSGFNFCVRVETHYKNVQSFWLKKTR